MGENKYVQQHVLLGKKEGEKRYHEEVSAYA